jgi:hypothetical protein
MTEERTHTAKMSRHGAAYKEGVQAFRDGFWPPWIEWAGGACPVPDRTIVEVNNGAFGAASGFNWGHVRRYRVLRKETA